MRKQYKIERNMRLFYRLRYTHHRFMATRDPETDTLSRALSRSDAANGADADAAVLPSISEAILGAQSAFGDSVQPGQAFDSGDDGREAMVHPQDELEGLQDVLDSIASTDDLYLDLRCAPWHAPPVFHFFVMPVMLRYSRQA